MSFWTKFTGCTLHSHLKCLTMLQKIFTSLLFTSVFYLSAAAQQASVASNSETYFSSNSKQEEKEDPKPSLLVTGSADVYFKYDISKQSGNNRTSFTNEIGRAHV